MSRALDDLRMRTSARFRGESVVTGEPVQAKLHNHFGGARRPVSPTLDVFEPFKETADIKQHVGEFRTDCFQRAVDLLTGGNHRVTEGSARAMPLPAARGRGIPTRGDLRRQIRAGEVGAQPLACLILYRLDQRLPVTPLAPREPCQRAFRIVDRDVDRTIRRIDAPAREVEVLRTKWTDLS